MQILNRKCKRCGKTFYAIYKYVPNYQLESKCKKCMKHGTVYYKRFYTYEEALVDLIIDGTCKIQEE